MNREIKFRAWDVNGKLMIGWDTIMQTAFNYGENKLTLLYRVLSRHTEYLIPMQFTGLKDKNGVEIYEGDIVTGGTNYDLYVRKKRRVSKIIFRRNGFWVEDEDFGWEGEGLWAWHEIEVIGNIFTNNFYETK